MKKSNLIAVDLAKNTFPVCLFDKRHNILSNQSIKSTDLANYLVGPEKVIHGLFQVAAAQKLAQNIDFACFCLLTLA